MASKLITIGDTKVRKSAITHFFKKKSSEIYETSFSDAQKYPYALCVFIGTYQIVNRYADEKDRDVDFEALVKAIEEEDNENIKQ